MTRQYYSATRRAVHEFRHPNERNTWVAENMPHARTVTGREAARLLHRGWPCYSHFEQENVVVLPSQNNYDERMRQRRELYARHLQIRADAAYYVVVTLFVVAALTLAVYWDELMGWLT